MVLLPLTVSIAGAAEAEQALVWPEVTNETKPWSRWWWLGNITSEADLRALIAEYARVGLGGLEVTPIYGVRGYEEQFVPFLSDTFVERLEFAGREAARHGLAIDMSTGTGWPFGGPWVDDATASRYLATRVFTVAAGGQLDTPVRLDQEPFLRFAGATRVPVEAIKQPVAANDNLQELAIDQVRFPRPLPLHTLMAYPPAGGGAPVDLTGAVGPDGRLQWTAPAAGGAWTLVAVFNGWHGKMVERAGPGGEGMAIDHLSANALAAYLAPFDRALQGKKPTGFRAWFNDSYEVDDAFGDSNFTARFFQEFEKRRGYDLRHYLPLLVDPKSGAAGDRVLCDYRETVSDLLLDQFTVPWRDWAARQQAIIRNQAHGSPANIIDLYAASDIPETEGSDIVQFKTASSAAHLTGKRLTSAEALTWLDEHWVSTLGDAKRAIDGFFLGGVNHICYHGTVYSPPDDAWPGFRFYAAVEFDPANPLWAHIDALNAYVTLAQSFLQAGRPDERVLLYYNIHDRWSERGNGELPHFHGSARDGMAVRDLGEALLAAGYGFDYVTDRLLAGARAEAGRAVVGDQHYDAIVLPRTRVMPLETIERVVRLAEAGVPVVVEGALPESVPGHGALAEREKQLTPWLLRARSGMIRVVRDVAAELETVAGALREPMVEQGLRYVRRVAGDGRVCYFVVNPGAERFDGWAPLTAGGEAFALFDPMTGAVGRAQTRVRESGGSEVRLQLDPGASVLVRAVAPNGDGPRWSYRNAAGQAETLSGTWTLEFKDGGPTVSGAITLGELTSWTELAGDAGKAYSGRGCYRLEFLRPAGDATVFELDLGRVAVSARVRLNGRELGTSFLPPHRLVVPADILAERNILEIEVVNLAANRIADLDRRGVAWKKFYNINMPAWRRENRGPDGLFSAADWTPRESGLLGPVTLTPMRVE